MTHCSYWLGSFHWQAEVRKGSLITTDRLKLLKCDLILKNQFSFLPKILLYFNLLFSNFKKICRKFTINRKHSTKNLNTISEKILYIPISLRISIEFNAKANIFIFSKHTILKYSNICILCKFRIFVTTESNRTLTRIRIRIKTRTNSGSVRDQFSSGSIRFVFVRFWRTFEQLADFHITKISF